MCVCVMLPSTHLLRHDISEGGDHLEVQQCDKIPLIWTESLSDSSNYSTDDSEAFDIGLRVQTAATDNKKPLRQEVCTEDFIHRSRRLSRHRQHRSVRRFIRLLGFVFVSLLVLMYVYLSFPTYPSPHRRSELLDWSYNKSRNVNDYITSTDDNRTLIEPVNLCQQKSFVIIIVCSAVTHFAERQAIRDTWGNTKQFNYGQFAIMHESLKGDYLEPEPQRVKLYREFLNMEENDTMIPSVLPIRVVFFVGRPKNDAIGSDYADSVSYQLNEEARQHDDLIQEDFIDSYSNLTLKSIYALKWMARNCLHNSAYVVKCDDDTFVNVPNLLHYLLGGTVPIYNDTVDMYDIYSYKIRSWYNRLNETSRLLMGYLFCDVQAISDINNKWYMPYYMYSRDIYPRYLSGGGYLMSTDVVKLLYDTALQIPIVYLEDIFITGLCAAEARIRPRHSQLFSYAYSQDMCSFRGTIIQHKLKLNNDDYNIPDVYAFVTNYANICPPPSKYFSRLRLKRAHCR